MNIIPLLEGKEGMTLYTPLAGKVTLVKIEEDHRIVTKDNKGTYHIFDSGGYYSPSSTECLLFPSFEQRDWKKYSKEPVGLGSKYFYVDIMYTGIPYLHVATNEANYEDFTRFKIGNYFVSMREGEEFVKQLKEKFSQRVVK